MKITSINNSKVLYWSKLKMKKYRDEEKLFIVESEHLVNEALKKNIVKEIITLDENFTCDVPVYEVTEEIMKKLSFLVCPSKVMAVCSYMDTSKISGNVLVLERLQDPGNLGTIIRSAVAFNFNTILISDDTVDVYNDKVIRASEGMIFNINIIRGNIFSLTDELKKLGYLLIGTNVRLGKNIKEYKDKKCAYIIGNEGSGMSMELEKMCDGFIKLPMENNCESLNAAVASSIIMYEVYHE